MWTTPKTNWTLSDRFNIRDYNRIKNNIAFLAEQVAYYFRPIEVLDMGEDAVDYTGYRRAEQFNAIEKNLEEINKAALNRDYGTTKQYYDNGAFIKYDELNRIESACVDLHSIIDRAREGLVDRRLEYVAGRLKEVVKV